MGKLPDRVGGRDHKKLRPWIEWEINFDGKTIKAQRESYRRAPGKGLPSFVKSRPSKAIKEAFRKYKNAFDLLSLSRQYTPHPQSLQPSEIKAFAESTGIEGEELKLFFSVLLRIDCFYLSKVREKFNQSASTSGVKKSARS